MGLDRVDHGEATLQRGDADAVAPIPEGLAVGAIRRVRAHQGTQHAGDVRQRDGGGVQRVESLPPGILNWNMALGLKLQVERHPVVEYALDGDVFIPNDTSLEADEAAQIILFDRAEYGG